MDRPAFLISDVELIAAHLRGDAAAFGELVRRHVDLVYAAALRRTGNAAMADDVTQAVFIILHQKLRSLRGRPTVAGWLVVVTRNVSRTAMRSRTRRQHHERAAARPEGATMNDATAVDASIDRSMNHASSSEPASAESLDIARLLDDGLARLGATERDAIVLRFLQAKPFAEVGQALGISEEAARKRTARGLERLRAWFGRSGLPVTAGGLSAAVLACAATKAPAATLTATLTPAAAGSTAITLSTGTLKMMAIQKAAAVTLAVLLGATAITGVTVLAQTPATTPMAPPAAPPQTARAAPPVVGEYYIGGEVKMPGAYSLAGRVVHLKQAIVAARTPLDPSMTIRLIRRDNGVENIRTIDLADVLSGAVDDPVLQPDDHLIINPAPVAAGQGATAVNTDQLNIQSLAVEIRVKDVEANIDFFQKAGFGIRFKDTPDANGRLPRASVFSGVVAVRLGRTTGPVHPEGMTAHFWVEGGPTALALRRDAIAANGIAVSDFNDDVGLRGFTISTPDGYRFGFYSLKQ